MEWAGAGPEVLLFEQALVEPCRWSTRDHTLARVPGHSCSEAMSPQEMLLDRDRALPWLVCQPQPGWGQLQNQAWCAVAASAPALLTPDRGGWWHQGQRAHSPQTEGTPEMSAVQPLTS